MANSIAKPPLLRGKGPKGQVQKLSVRSHRPYTGAVAVLFASLVLLGGLAVISVV